MKTQRKPKRESGRRSELPHHVESKKGTRFYPVNPLKFVPEIKPTDKFTVAEHLRVQREIEQRAHRLWRLNGCGMQTALSDWLQAEVQVLIEFIEARMQVRPMPPDFGGSPSKTWQGSHWPPETRSPFTTQWHPELT